MSIFRTITVGCPACGAESPFEAVDSLNADRRPDLRDAILDGSFQTIECPKCGEKSRLDPRFNHLDVGRGQWISVQPLDGLPDWIATEDQTIATFAKTFGEGAPPAVRELTRGIRPRLVFGWAALREKLVARDCDLDDVALELLKLTIIDGLGQPRLERGAELRFERIVDDELEMNWIDARTEGVLETIRVPRMIFDDIVRDVAAWSEVREKLETGPFVDMQKLYLGQGRPVTA